MFHHSVQNSQQFAHAGGDSGFLSLAGRNQPFVETSDDSITSGSYQCRHIECCPDLGSAAPNSAFPAKLPAIAVKGATPARAAICLRFKLPSSGSSASRVEDRIGPTPGTLAKGYHFLSRLGLC